MNLVYVTQEHINNHKLQCPILAALKEKFGPQVEVEHDCNPVILFLTGTDVSLPGEAMSLMNAQEALWEVGEFNGVDLLQKVWGGIEPFVMDVSEEGNDAFAINVAPNLKDLHRLRDEWIERQRASK